MTNSTKQFKDIRVGNRDDYVDALRDGRRQRASTFADRKKKANRDACRKAPRGGWS